MSCRAPLPRAAALALVLSACATVVPLPPPGALSTTADQPFGIDGRLSARRGSDAAAVAFSWTHRTTHDDFVLTTPLGQALAELSGDTSSRRMELRAADGHREEASDWSTLTARVVGIPLPVESLAWWARGAPRPSSPHTIEYDAAGRPNAIRQDGCAIVYSYFDEAAHLPSRLRLECGDVEVRIIIDRWRVG